MRTVFFFVSVAVGIVHSDTMFIGPNLTLTLNALRCSVSEVPQLFCLPPMQSRRNRECSVHSDDARIEVELGYAFQAARWALLDTHAATLAVIDENLIQTVRTNVAHDARLRTNEVAIIASIAGAAAETAARLFDGLLFRISLNHLILRLFPSLRRQQFLLDAREVREVGHVHAVQIEDHIDRNLPRFERHSAQHLIQIESYSLPVANRVDHHQRLARTYLRDIPCRKEVRIAEPAKAVHF